jgi:uncharacterized protein (TIGR02246 family)
MSMNTEAPTGALPAGSDAAALAALPQRIVDAWEAHDPDAFAAVFAEDGSMILPGVYCKGRGQIRTFMAEGFAGRYRGTRITGEPMDLRLLSDSSAVLLTQGGVLAPGETAVDDRRAIRASWVAVKRAGQWQLAAYQNSPRDAG